METTMTSPEQNLSAFSAAPINGGAAAHLVALAAGKLAHPRDVGHCIFPGAVVPLLVETGPSLKLIDDIVSGDRLFAAVLQRKPEVVEPAPEDLYEVGCVSRLSKW